MENSEIMKYQLRFLEKMHRNLKDRQSELRQEALTLGREIKEFQYFCEETIKNMRKELPNEFRKEINEEVKSLISSIDYEKITENSSYETLEKLEVKDPENENNTVRFFSEHYLYNTIGKEDARTVLACMRTIFAKAGMPCNI